MNQSGQNHLQQESESLPSTKRLTPEDVLDIIEKNGGPRGVNFDGVDLSKIVLDFEVVRKKVDACRRSQPAWYSGVTHGVNLRGATFRNANLTGAVLAGADLTGASLNEAHMHLSDFHDSKFTDSFLVRLYAPEAIFVYCDMRGCFLLEADLRGANLSSARLQGSDLSGAKLNDAILCDAKLAEADLTGAELTGANLFRAWLVGTFLTRQQIGERIIQESEMYEDPVCVHDDQRVRLKSMPGRYAQAASVYRSLKSNFLSIGSYDDASWAYVKERKMRKRTHWPPKRVRESYPAEFNRLPTEGLRSSWSRLKFYTRHLASFILDWVFELTSNYGENPSLTLYWALALILGFSLLFYGIGGIVGAETWLDHLNYSLGAFVTMSFSEFRAASSAAKTLTSIESLLGICTLALLMFALGNRINRS